MIYYDENASKFIENTLNVDMSHLYERFTKFLKPGSRILDLGCGPGRDVKAFNQMSFDTTGIEPSDVLRKFAEAYTGQIILSGTAQGLNFKSEFDGIWACASILHVAKNDLPQVLEKMKLALKPDGIIYVSFKHGDFSGIRSDGRYFLDMNSKKFSENLDKIKNLEILEEWLTSDVRHDNSTEWYNVLLKRI